MEKAALTIAEVRTSKDDPDVLEFIASTDHVDRAGDVVEQNFDLKNLRANPVFLWAHKYAEPPIGKIIKIWSERIEGSKGEGTKAPRTGTKRTKIQVKFVPRETYPFAGLVRDLYHDGFMKTVSIGFRPLEVRELSQEQRDELGMNFLSQWFKRSEMLEVSGVPIPMNQEALQTPVSRGFTEPDLETLDPNREQLLKDVDIAAVHRALDAIEADPEWAHAVATSGTLPDPDAVEVEFDPETGETRVVEKGDPAPAPRAVEPIESDTPTLIDSVATLISEVRELTGAIKAIVPDDNNDTSTQNADDDSDSSDAVDDDADASPDGEGEAIDEAAVEEALEAFHDVNTSLSPAGE